MGSNHLSNVAMYSIRIRDKCTCLILNNIIMSEKNFKRLRQIEKAKTQTNHKHLVSEVIRWKSVLPKTK